ncbi:MAG: substrate-binding domain-containing protein [Candidatus Pristimantibacillus sp.]
MRRFVMGILIVLVIGSAGSFTVYKLISNGLKPTPISILFVPKTLDTRIEFWHEMRQGIDAALKEFGAEIQVVGTESESDIAGQIQILEKKLLDKPKVVILASTDYEQLVPIAQKYKDAGIPLITVDAGVEGDIATSFIATDNYAAGVKAGQTILQLVPKESTIAVMNTVKGSATAMERERGFRDSIASSKGIQLIETNYNGGLGQISYEYARKLLLENSNINGFICLNESSTVGTAQAIKDMASLSVKLVGFDSSMEEIALLEDRVLQATVVQNPYNMGYLAVEAAVKAYKGKNVKKFIDTGSEVITKENMYTKENQKLLFPFVEK